MVSLSCGSSPHNRRPSGEGKALQHDRPQPCKQSQGGGDYFGASLCQAQYGSVSAPVLNAVIVPAGATAPACGGTG